MTYRTSDDMLTYNALDCAVTWQCVDGFFAEIEDGYRETYDHTIELYQPLMYMMVRGMKVDRENLEKVKVNVDKQIIQLAQDITERCGRWVNPNSSKDCQAYFYIEKGIQPYTKYNKKTGKSAISVDDKALQRIARGTAAKRGLHEAKLMQEYRKLKKLKGTYLDINFDVDGRLRCSYNSRGCLLGETEVLTKNGWIRLDSYNDGDEVLQWSPDKKLSWTIPKFVSFDCDEELYECDAEQHKCVYTNDHRIPTYTPTYDKKFNPDRTAEDVSKRQRLLPVSGLLKSGTLNTPEAARILAMVQADGCITDTNIILNLKNKYKIARCKYLLENSNLSYTLPKGNEGYVRFCIRSESAKPIIDILGKEKLYGSWMLQWDAVTMDVFLEEIRYWDAEIGKNQFRYHTKEKINADWVSTIAHLRGRSSHIQTMFTEQNRNPIYRVSIKNTDKVNLLPNYWKRIYHKGKVYCLITDTSFFLARYKNNIFVTGNTKFGRLSSSKTVFETGMNMQNLPEAFLGFLVADDDMILIELDKAKAEWVVVAYDSGDANMINAIESGVDVHAYTASRMFGVPIDIIEAEDKIIEHSNDPEVIYEKRGRMPWLKPYIKGWLPRTMSMRQCGKKSNHSLNYGEKYKMFALINEIIEKEAKVVVDMYHSTYPGIGQWYSYIQGKLSSGRTLTNCFGRKCRFLDRWGDELFKAAYSFNPQSTVGEILNRGMVDIYNSDKPELESWEILRQVHDSIDSQYPDRSARGVAKGIIAAASYLDPTLEARGRTFNIKTDCKIGYVRDKMISISITDEDSLTDQIGKAINVLKASQ